jgi:hypothetical protein
MFQIGGGIMSRLRQGLVAIFWMLAGAVLLVVAVKGAGLSFGPNRNVSESEFVSIILTALGVMLTAVTVFLGALAIIGWSTFETRVQQSAEAFMNRRFADEDPDYQAFVMKVEAQVNQNAEQFLERRFSENDPRYAKLVDDLKRDSLGGNTETYDEENDSPFDENAA